MAGTSSDDANKKTRLKANIASIDGVQTFEEDTPEKEQDASDSSKGVNACLGVAPAVDGLRSKGRFTGKNGLKLTPNVKEQ